MDVEVADDGPGLATTANLFVPFYTTKPSGTGIGLVLCRQIAEAHGGVLSLENRGDRRGCVARVRLPVTFRDTRWLGALPSEWAHAVVLRWSHAHRPGRWPSPRGHESYSPASAQHATADRFGPSSSTRGCSPGTPASPRWVSSTQPPIRRSPSFARKRITHVVLGDFNLDPWRSASMSAAVAAYPHAFRRLYQAGVFTVYAVRLHAGASLTA